MPTLPFNASEANWGTQAELDAINDILSSVGEAPVNTLEGDSNLDVVNARRILAKINRQEQTKGWTFNIDEGATLRPDVFTKLITYSQDFLLVQSAGGTIYVNRGGYLYDRVARTDQFSSTVNVNLIRLVSYEEMPEAFKEYIVARASKQFNIRFFGAPDVDTILQNEITDLYQTVMEYELDYGAYNIFSSDPFVSDKIGRS